MDKTAALSSVPGITVTPVKLENDQIFRGNSVMQLGEGGAGQLSADGLTVQTDGDGAGQPIWDSALYPFFCFIEFFVS